MSAGKTKRHQIFKSAIFAFAVSLFSVAPTFVAWAEDIATTTPTPPVAVATTTTPIPTLQTNDGVEARVRQYFADAPIMIEIARCESGFREFGPSGQPLNGGSGGMIGIFQINAAVHSAYAKSLGLDIDTVEGNIGYARLLYAEDGTSPWLASISCWGSGSSSSATTPENPAVSTTGVTPVDPTSVFASNLSLGTISPEVESLQIILNNAGFTVAASGPGSPGNDTTKFGSLTKDAVQRFQCAQKIVCSGDEYTTGYGFVGTRTRSALLTFVNSGTVASGAVSPAPVASSPVSTVSDPAVDPPDVVALKSQISALQSQLADLEAQLKVKTGQ
jgi:hypothetical protein